MRIMICGLTREIGNNKFDELVEENKENILQVVRLEDGNNRFTTVNGDYYKVIFPIMYYRASRCDRIYIDKNIEDELKYTLLFPLVCNSQLPIDERIIYF